ncbi:MAG TPA: electron transfer flavoprotein subunit beta/FixA family protein [Caldisericia bacterium]|nr:electron transfer flavoprotein subunit beta/FixA family protein [Caldisericia bacterium]HPF48484.1 electron transfer flavoprotein subunit beta/FixA family protein [Caldisericia bacterium]HPI83336.1 electron transfer flavoprotein subunit beta/FixA family protein [Caldisericia bacterium]HPQ92938.1 electron transfer flavoprotein subunit beta/FixA family protein [Caldisericia bacterium]HRV73964.1 electron transfer flavoprotein subunit beta/FixA family protein [Caldisericia bacterium]
MHIAVLIKQVPDTQEVKIDPEKNTIVRAGVESIVNPFDMNAVELALQLVEKHGGEVSVITMGPPQAEAALKETLAMGVTRVLLITDRKFAAADTLATSYTLAKAIEKLSAESGNVDLIICGKQAVDGDTAQTGPGVATRLNFDQATYVTTVDKIDIESKKIVVKRRLAKGVEIVEASLPALITVEKDINEPRYASLPGLVKAERDKIAWWDAAYIGADDDHIGFKGSPTWVKKIFTPPPREGGPELSGESAVKEALDLVFENKHFKEAVLGEEGA